MENMQSIRKDLEIKIMEKLKEPLTCKEIYDLAAAYAELSKDAWLPMTYTPSFGCEMRYEKEKTDD